MGTLERCWGHSQAANFEKMGRFSTLRLGRSCNIGTPDGRKTPPSAGKRDQWPENGTPGRETVPLTGKRYSWQGSVFPISENAPPISENATDFATKRAISLFPKIKPLGEIARKFDALPDLEGRHSHLAGKRYT